MKVEQFFNDLLTSECHYISRSNKTGHILVAALNSTATVGQVEAPARDNRKAITFSAVLVQPISCLRNVVVDAPKKIARAFSRGRTRGCERNDLRLACSIYDTRRPMRRTENCQIVAQARS